MAAAVFVHVGVELVVGTCGVVVEPPAALVCATKVAVLVAVFPAVLVGAADGVELVAAVGCKSTPFGFAVVVEPAVAVEAVVALVLAVEAVAPVVVEPPVPYKLRTCICQPIYANKRRGAAHPGENLLQ